MWRRIFTCLAMETVIEISSGEEDNLLIMEPKKSKTTKRGKCKFHRKNYTWRWPLHIKLFFNVFWKGLLRNSLFTMERISGKHSPIHGFQ